MIKQKLDLPEPKPKTYLYWHTNFVSQTKSTHTCSWKYILWNSFCIALIHHYENYGSSLFKIQFFLGFWSLPWEVTTPLFRQQMTKSPASLLFMHNPFPGICSVRGINDPWVRSLRRSTRQARQDRTNERSNHLERLHYSEDWQEKSQQWWHSSIKHEPASSSAIIYRKSPHGKHLVPSMLKHGIFYIQCSSSSDVCFTYDCGRFKKNCEK